MWQEQTMSRKILIPLDGSAAAETILPQVLALGLAAPATMLLLRVVEPVQLVRHIPADPAVRALDDQLIDRLIVDAQSYLEQLAERLDAPGLAVQTRVVVAPQAAAAILEQAQSDTPDLIAMATHARRGLARVLLGSVAETVLREASVPVLLYRPPAHPAGEPANPAAVAKEAIDV
jgi:nucleotide-binding universal stress UspA family protein